MRTHYSSRPAFNLAVLVFLFLGASACEEPAVEVQTPSLPTAGGFDRAEFLADEQAGHMVAAAVRHEYGRLTEAQPELRPGRVVVDPSLPRTGDVERCHAKAVTDRVMAEMNARLIRHPNEQACLFTADADCSAEPIGVIVRHLAPSLRGDTGSVRLGLTYALDGPAHHGVAYNAWIEVGLESRDGVWEVVRSEVQSIGTLGPPPPWAR